MKKNRRKKKQHEPNIEAGANIMALQIMGDCGMKCWQPTDPYEKARKERMRIDADVSFQRMFFVAIGGEEWAEKMTANDREWLKQRHAEIDAELAAATGGAS